MGGFLPLGLGLLAPIGQTLGPALQMNDIAKMQDLRNQAAQGIVEGLPDEFQALKQAGQTSGDWSWALSNVTGPLGSQLRQQHLAQTVQKLMAQNPGMTAEQALSRAALDEGDLDIWSKLAEEQGKAKPTLQDKLNYFASRMGPNDLPPDLQRQGANLLANPSEPGAEAFGKALENFDNKKIGRRTSPFTYTSPSGITYGGGTEPEVEAPSEEAAPGWGVDPGAAPSVAVPGAPVPSGPAAAPTAAAAPVPPTGMADPGAASTVPPAAATLPPDVRAAIPRGVEGVHALKPAPASAAIRTAVAPMGSRGLRLQNDFLSLGGGDYETSKLVWDRSKPERIAAGTWMGIFGEIPTANPILAQLYPELDSYQESSGIARRLAAGGRAGYGTRRAETIIKPTSDFDSIMTVIAADRDEFRETLDKNGLPIGPEFDQIKTLSQLRTMRPAGGSAPSGHADITGRAMRWK